MKRCFLFLSLLVSEYCAGQFTTVMGTVVDPDGIPYSYGTISGILIFSGGTPKLPSGSPYILPTQRTGFDASGHFVVTLADNNQLTPTGSKWNFEVCSAAGTIQQPLGNGPICFKLASPITITGPTQDITTNLNAVAPALTKSTGGSLADPGANGIIKRTSLNVTAPAGFADVTALFSSCSGTQYLGADGACHTGLSSTLPGIVSATNPTTGNDPNDRRMVDFTVTTDSTTSNPVFSDENNFQITETATNGQGNYGTAVGGGQTLAKKTFIALAMTGNMQGSGQKALLTETQNCYSMSDCFAEQHNVTFSGGPIAGDEGQAIEPVSYLQQQGHLNLSTITAVARSTCNTTLTQIVNAAQAVQTFTVGSTTGCNVNDWVVIAQENPTGSPAESLMQITAVGSGTLSGQVIGNYSSGNTVTPATVLTTTGDGFPWGQDRVVTNLTSTPYSTGTVTSISGGAFTGTGTGWTAAMVGGNAANNIGCIALSNDDYNAAPFTGSGETGLLKAWYPILAVSSATSLGILSMSVAGDAAYHGNGVGSGAYTIRPCAKALRVSGDSRTIILDTNSFTWNVNDTIEETLNPYPDVTAFQYHLAQYTPGGVRRAFMQVSNIGARMFQDGILITSNMPSGGGADTVAWDTGLSIGNSNVGVRSQSAATGANFYAFGAASGVGANPCYAFAGGNLGGGGVGSGFTPFGLCADTTNQQVFVNAGASSTPYRINFPILAPNATRTITQTSAGSTGKVACWKDATSTLGFCSTQPDSTGACTCN